MDASALLSQSQTVAGWGVHFPGTVLLAESHLAIHTWPEKEFVTTDVYVCNHLHDNGDKALNLYSAMRAYFKPAHENFS